MESDLSDKEILFRLAGLYGSIISKEEIKKIYANKTNNR